MTPLTPRQHEVLAFIRRFLADRGFAPTHAEIARGLGFRSPNAAAQHVRLLAKKGVLAVEPRVARGLRILGESPEEDLAGGAGLPLIGEVAAGQPILAEAHVERRLALAPDFFRPRADYLLRVRGDSMIEAGLVPGDLVAVHRQGRLTPGCMAVVRLDDEVTVKHVYQHDNYIDLVPANPDYKRQRWSLDQDRVAIEGLVVGLLRLGSRAFTAS